jgi:hypothetical protein
MYPPQEPYRTRTRLIFVILSEAKDLLLHSFSPTFSIASSAIVLTPDA